VDEKAYALYDKNTRQTYWDVVKHGVPQISITNSLLPSSFPLKYINDTPYAITSLSKSIYSKLIILLLLLSSSSSSLVTGFPSSLVLLLLSQW
jgi:hypothetical protein